MPKYTVKDAQAAVEAAKVRSVSSNREVGRPSKYKTEYCKMLIHHMDEGFSFLSFAATIDVAEDTIVEWCNAHPEFSLAKKQGFSKSRYFWEKMSVASEINPTILIFNLKNRFPREWRDRHEVEQQTTHSIDESSLQNMLEQAKLLVEKL